MPNIDVDEVLIDADVAGDTFDVIRRPASVNNYGEGGVREEITPDVLGSVFPSAQNSMVREEAYTTGMKSISVVTQFRLRQASNDAGQDYQPDLVAWAGDRYIVREVKDFSRYGAGFIQADCLQIAFVGAPPQPSPPWLGEMDFQDPVQSGLIGAI